MKGAIIVHEGKHGILDDLENIDHLFGLEDEEGKEDKHKDKHKKEKDKAKATDNDKPKK